MTARDICRHLFKAHLCGSYTAAFVAAGMYTEMHMGQFVEAAFPIFLAPLLLPFLLLIESEKQAVVCGTVYCAVFCIAFVWLWRRQARWEVVAEKMYAAARENPLPIAQLAYPSAAPVQSLKYGKIELVAAGFGLFGFFAPAAYVGFLIWKQNAGVQEKPITLPMMWMFLIPTVIAAMTGLFACFKTRPKTKQRNAAFLGLVLGFVAMILVSFGIYVMYAGLAQY